MKVAVAQLDPVVGAFEANVKRICEAYRRACTKKADLLLTPELGICGYPPHDLVERPEFFDACESALEELRAVTASESCALVVGHVAPTPSEFGRASQNVVTVLQGGKRIFRQAKTLLPTYDIFDEARYFEPAEEVGLWSFKGKKIALAICEDLWANDPILRRPIYKQDPLERYAELGAEIVFSVSASPYEWNKRDRREKLHTHVAETLKAPLVYVNQVGGNDEVLFDGGSFAVGSDGEFAGRLPLFKTSFGVVELQETDGGMRAVWESPGPEVREEGTPDEMDVLFRGLITGIRDYFKRTGFRKAMLGLSGGIDSAVVATLAAQALGPENVTGVAMPSQFSSGGSLSDAEALARALRIRFEVRPIKFLYSTASRELSEGRGSLDGIALENLQARLRGMTLMTLANHEQALVLSTGNKSEIAVGYCTLYGDMCGALSPIGDLFKTRVYELARYLNAQLGNCIPESSLTKAPSAELRPHQTDQDTLPPYDALDQLLEDYIERRCSLPELIKKHSGKKVPQGAGWVQTIIRQVERFEFKRRQGAPVLKVSAKAFGLGRRMPIAKTSILPTHLE